MPARARLALALTVVAAAPPPGLTPAGRTLWQFEALLHDRFGRAPVSAHYDRRHSGWEFASCRSGCAPHAYWSDYVFSFQGAGDSPFHLARRQARPNAGNYPLPVRVRLRFVACDRAERTFLFTYGSAAGLSFGCLRSG